MITALLHLLHLLNRWDSVHRCASRANRRPQRDRSARRNRTTSPGRRIRSSPVPYLRALRSDIGMTTAEYAVGTVAAVAFAVVLFKVVQSPQVHSALAAVVTGALNVHL